MILSLLSAMRVILFLFVSFNIHSCTCGESVTFQETIPKLQFFVYSLQ